MTRALMVGLLVIGTGPVAAGDGDKPERIEGEEALKIGKLCSDALAKSTAAAPVKVNLSVKHGVGIKARKAGVLIVPDGAFSAKTIEQADKQIVPLGVLFAHKITIVPADEPVSPDKHRTIDITVGDKSAQLAAMHLGVTKVAGRLALVVYTDSKTPVVVTTLAESDKATELPLDLEVRPIRDERALLHIIVLGKYRAALTIAAQP